MKIASFNINNINRRLANLLGWLREAEPDIVCLQELKAADTEFPADVSGRPVIMRYGAARSAGTAWRSSRGGRRS
jgi:exonuclease III